VIAGITDMARRLGISVVAEGIENAEQHTRLRELGCAFGQGFLFARAMPASKLRRYLSPVPSPAAAPTRATRRTSRAPAPARLPSQS
jgi:EAL domain-containing protein (putative c-di-GMP-specific phosphodiesterase class I)